MHQGKTDVSWPSVPARAAKRFGTACAPVVGEFKPRLIRMVPGVFAHYHFMPAARGADMTAHCEIREAMPEPTHCGVSERHFAQCTVGVGSWLAMAQQDQPGGFHGRSPGKAEAKVCGTVDHLPTRCCHRSEAFQAKRVDKLPVKCGHAHDFPSAASD